MLSDEGLSRDWPSTDRKSNPNRVAAPYSYAHWADERVLRDRPIEMALPVVRFLASGRERGYCFADGNRPETRKSNPSVNQRNLMIGMDLSAQRRTQGLKIEANCNVPNVSQTGSRGETRAIAGKPTHAFGSLTGLAIKLAVVPRSSLVAWGSPSSSGSFPCRDRSPRHSPCRQGSGVPL
jgi:hypothetical protein